MYKFVHLLKSSSSVRSRQPPICKQCARILSERESAGSRPSVNICVPIEELEFGAMYNFKYL